MGPYKQSPRNTPPPILNTHNGLETLVCETSNQVDYVIIKIDIPNHHNKSMMFHRLMFWFLEILFEGPTGEISYEMR